MQSQRYVSYEKGFGYIVPPKIAALGPEAQAEYQAQMAQMHAWYVAWQEKLGQGEGSNEDARFVLPGACETRLMVTMNVRELRHFFGLRMCRRAQWEIRALATEMHRLCMEVAPALVRRRGRALHFGPLPRRRKVLRTHAGNASGAPGAAGIASGYHPGLTPWEPGSRDGKRKGVISWPITRMHPINAAK